MQIGFGLLPEQHGVLLWSQKTGKFLVGIDSAPLTLAFKLCQQGFNRPVDHSVGRIVEHLSDHFAADTGVTAAFHFDNRWDSILVEKEVIDLALREHQGNVSKAAEMLGVNRTTLYGRMGRLEDKE